MDVMSVDRHIRPPHDRRGDRMILMEAHIKYKTGLRPLTSMGVEARQSVFGSECLRPQPDRGSGSLMAHAAQPQKTDSDGMTCFLRETM